MPGEPSRRRSGRSHEALGNERPRGMAIPAAGLLRAAGQNPAYMPSGTAAQSSEHFKNLFPQPAIFAAVIPHLVIGIGMATT
jgi:hypothetical protein